MAKVGMEYVVSAHFEESDNPAKPTYTKGRYWGPSAAVQTSPNVSDVTDFGDDRAVETEKNVSTLGFTVELNESDLELEADILGHTFEEGTGELVDGAEDENPYLGIGFVGKSKRDGKLIFRGIWYPKVIMSVPGDDYATKTDTTTFNHSTYEGTIMPLADAKKTYRRRKEFETLDEAKAWLNAKAGIVA